MTHTKTNKHLIRSIILMLFVCCNLAISAQTDTLSTTIAPPPIQTVKAENWRKVDFRVPDKKKIEEYQKDKRFQYFEKKEVRGSSWFDRLKSWIVDKIFRALSETISSGIGTYVIIGIIGIIIALIIIKLMGVNVRAILGKKSLDTPEIEIYTENVHEMDFDTLINNALKNKEYRLAVRFLYLKNLKALSDKSIINWDVNKTNYSYQYEISNNAIRSKFLEATFIFDYVWYGEFLLDERSFAEINNRMNEFNKMIAR